jgi:hypothetical protein
MGRITDLCPLDCSSFNSPASRYVLALHSPSPPPVLRPRPTSLRLLPKAHPKQLVIFQLLSFFLELDNLRIAAGQRRGELTGDDAFGAEGASGMVEEDLGEDGEDERMAGGEYRRKL